MISILAIRWERFPLLRLVSPSTCFFIRTFDRLRALIVVLPLRPCHFMEYLPAAVRLLYLAIDSVIIGTGS
jgi:hypothetical protein|nr:hypothetical protein Q903MT_gene163 [Picea sitchensis]